MNIIENALNAMSNPDNYEREKARDFLINEINKESFLNNLIDIFEKNKNNNDQILMNVLITVKESLNSNNYYGQKIKEFLINNHIEYINGNKVLKKLLEENISILISKFFPENFLDLFDYIKSKIFLDNNLISIKSSLSLLLLIFEEFKTDINKQDLFESLTDFFIPGILNMCSEIINSSLKLEEYLDILILSCKIINCSINLGLDLYYNKNFYSPLIKFLNIVWKFELNENIKNELKLKNLIIMNIAHMVKFINNLYKINEKFEFFKEVYYVVYNILNDIFDFYLINNHIIENFQKIIKNIFIFIKNILKSSYKFLDNEQIVIIFFKYLFPFINYTKNEKNLIEFEPTNYIYNEFRNDIKFWEIKNLPIEILLLKELRDDIFFFVLNIVTNCLINKKNYINSQISFENNWESYLFIINESIEIFNNPEIYKIMNIKESEMIDKTENLFKLIISFFNLEDNFLTQRLITILFEFEYKNINDDENLLILANLLLDNAKKTEDDIIKLKSVILITNLISNKKIKEYYEKEFNFLFKVLLDLSSKYSDEVDDFSDGFKYFINIYIEKVKPHSDYLLKELMNNFKKNIEKIINCDGLISKQIQDVTDSNIIFIKNILEISENIELINSFKNDFAKLYLESLFDENLNYFNFSFIEILNLITYKLNKENIDYEFLFIYSIICYLSSNTINNELKVTNDFEKLDDLKKKVINEIILLKENDELEFDLLFPNLCNFVSKVDLKIHNDIFGINFFQLSFNVIDKNLEEGFKENDDKLITLSIKYIGILYENNFTFDQIYLNLINYQNKIYELIQHKKDLKITFFQMISKFLYINNNKYLNILKEQNQIKIIEGLIEYILNNDLKEEYVSINLLFGIIGLFKSDYSLLTQIIGNNLFKVTFILIKNIYKKKFVYENDDNDSMNIENSFTEDFDYNDDDYIFLYSGPFDNIDGIKEIKEIIENLNENILNQFLNQINDSENQKFKKYINFLINNSD